MGEFYCMKKNYQNIEEMKERKWQMNVTNVSMNVTNESNFISNKEHNQLWG